MNQVDIENRRNEKINELKLAKEIILSKYELELLMLDINDRIDNGTYYDDIWFKLYTNIAKKTTEKYNIMNTVKQNNNVYDVKSLYLDDSELLLLELGETIDEVLENINRYYTILENSKDTIGIKLDKKEINNLLHIINSRKPSEEENKSYYQNITSEFNTKIISR